MSAAFLTAHPLLAIDAAAAVDHIIRTVREQVRYGLARRGAVVAVSGGIDSSVTLKLCALAFGPENVVGLLMPERESSEQTRRLSRLAAEYAAVEAIEQDITPALEGAGCYRLRDEAVHALIPDYGAGWRCKLVNTPVLEGGGGGLFTLVAEGPDGHPVEVEPPIEILRQVVAASNFKQRTRKMMEYYHADLNNYAVAGTSNRMEADLGFFVKLGDGAGDVKPIAHLYKSQVYSVAGFLGLPSDLLAVAPTPDTYPLSHDAQEFFFALPLETLDLCLFCRNNRHSEAQTAEATGLAVEQVRAVWADMAAKRATAGYLASPPLLVPEACEDA